MAREANRYVYDCFPTGRHYPGISHLIAAREKAHPEGAWREIDVASPWGDLSLAIIDFETTGLEASRDRVLEIGVVLFDRGQLSQRYNTLINPGIPVPEEAKKVHGITDEDLADAPVFAEIAPKLSELLQQRIPVAYNAGFDRGFLHAEVKRLEGAHASLATCPACDAQVQWIDPLVWVRHLQKYERGKKLTDVCARLGITLDNAHRAASDAEATGHVLYALAPQMPKAYGELIRLQRQYAKQQEVEMQRWRSQRKG